MLRAEFRMEKFDQFEYETAATHGAHTVRSAYGATGKTIVRNAEIFPEIN